MKKWAEFFCWWLFFQSLVCLPIIIVCWMNYEMWDELRPSEQHGLIWFLQFICIPTGMVAWLKVRSECIDECVDEICMSPIDFRDGGFGGGDNNIDDQPRGPTSIASPIGGLF